MKLQAAIAIVGVSFAGPMVCAEEDGPYGISTGIGQIEGSRLKRFDTATWPVKDSENVTISCQIGYNGPGDVSGNNSFFSVLTLPSLNNDRYETVIREGKLHITKASDKKMVLILDLAKLVPTVLGDEF